MKKLPSFLTPSTWTFIILTLLGGWILFRFADLAPHVDQDVFFASDDPSYQADITISENFERSDAQILVSFAGDIQDPRYQERVKKFGDLLLDFDEIKDVKSIVHGPKSVKDAANSPLWSRLLISGHGRSSNMLVGLRPGVSQDDFEEIIPKIESLKHVFERDRFQVRLSGFPYITELIRRHLNTDLKMFTILAFGIFGAIVIFIFHSWQIFLGMVIACLNAAALTLISSHLLDIKVGILTANLTTIVFVLTLSHIVFLTFNWRHLHHIEDRHEAAREAVRITIPASFWAMVTTLLGFISLLFVQAKPIRELGTAGAIGTLIAFFLAYGIYPSFLRLRLPSQEKVDAHVDRAYQAMLAFFEQQKVLIVIALTGAALLAVPYLKNLNLDPGLISFFSPKSQITEGLKYIDEHGGSNPMVMMVGAKDGSLLSSKENINKLMALQKDLEQNPNVGTLISVPLLVEEARRASFLSFLFSNQNLLQRMAKPEYGRISRGFISDDHKKTLLLFRMNDQRRDKHRLEVIAEIRAAVRSHGFTPLLTGGVYALQGNLSKHVASSLIYGLGRLLLIFLVIALIVSRSVRGALAMGFSISLVPLCILGVFGAFRMPLDIIAAPAANIAISMGIDAMIHMIHAYHRIARATKKDPDIWATVRERMWEPVITSMFIVASGFAIFFFSSFPPTQRFGGSIVLGTVIAAFAALFVFPMLAGTPGARRKRKAPEKKKPQKQFSSHRFQGFNDSDLN